MSDGWVAELRAELRDRKERQDSIISFLAFCLGAGVIAGVIVVLFT